ncbi:hypothetical protein ACFX13_006621 [Malus domestica]
MSGGIRDVRAEDITAIDTQSSVRIKTAVGRGAYVEDIYVRRITLKSMKYVFWMTGSYGSHPDPGFDPKALPLVTEKPKKLQWNCTDVQGITGNVTPKACDLLPEKQEVVGCAFPDDRLAIEDVKLVAYSASTPLFWEFLL